ncbi:curli production assembly/transport protein CsgE [Pusillimonas sp.]|uniref:curli production assembly/transport protein CsgE n=1 Tax=Pusillimonas sp. TaxID=3040095 RepID=UPI0037CA5FEA
MTRCIKHCQAALFTLVLVAAYAATATLDEDLLKTQPEKSLLDDPLSGIVVNRTVTVLGNDFYQYFARAWREKDGDHRYSLSVHERPSARWGSEIWVQYRQQQVFHMFLSPARQAAKDVSQQAARIVYENVVNSDIQRMLVQSQDLGEEEL